MYKQIFVCSNCGTEFDERELIDDCTIDECVNYYVPPFAFVVVGYHKCAGGEIGMKVFKCFREVRE